MKVLMLLDKEFPNDERVEKESESLIKLGFKVTILCPTFTKKKKLGQVGEIQVVRFGINKSLFNKLLGLVHLLPLYKLYWLFQISKITKNEKFSAIHIHDLPLCTLAGKLKKRGFIIIADMHENYPAMVSGQEHYLRFPYKYLLRLKTWYKREKQWLDNSDVIICTAEGMVKRLRDLRGIGKQFIYLPNTLSISKFEREQQVDEKLEAKFKDTYNLIIYGVVSEQRGIQYVVDAAYILKDVIPALKVIVVGNGKYLTQLQNKISLLGLSSIVVLEGWQHQKYLNSYMKNASLAVIPHLKSEHTDNTSPNKLYMYNYFKAPVIVSNCKFLEDVVTEYNMGLVFESGNVISLAESIKVLYNDPIKAKKLGVNGYNSLVETNNWEVTSLGLTSWYTENVFDRK